VVKVKIEKRGERGWNVRLRKGIEKKDLHMKLGKGLRKKIST